MRWAELLQEIRIMRFEEAYGVWTEKRLSQDGYSNEFRHGNMIIPPPPPESA